MKYKKIYFPSVVCFLILALTSCTKTDDCKPASTASAGPDQEITGTSTNLAAEAPTSGAGMWSIVSGDGGNITNPATATSEFTGVAGTTYVLKWTVSGCPTSEDEVQIAFNNNPKLLTVDKTSTINGEIITIAGLNFASNYQGMSQIKAVNQADNTKEVFLPIISRTATEIKAVMMGTGGGSVGSYKLYYGKRPDANAAVFFESSLIVSVVAPGGSQFFSSSTYASTNIEAANVAANNVAFGVKNGSATAGDYTVKLVLYNYETGVNTETTVANFNFTVAGYDTLDKIDFTFPGGLTVPGTYWVKVTYNGATVIGGWGYSLNVY